MCDMTFFILGSHPDISIAEIKAIVGERPVFGTSKNVLLLEDVDENLGELQERLAGTIKIGRIIGEMDIWNTTEVSALIASVVSEAAGKNKIEFGLSDYGIKQDLSTIGKEIKKQVKQTGRPVRYVSSREPQLSSVIVKENHLLESGGEFVFLVSAEKILIGQTETVQDYKAWSKRDYGRPERDAKSGMLPPKLARMMINLSGIDPKKVTLLDPFVGSGTILMEAALLGCKKLIGSDISEKAIHDSKRNWNWLVQNFELPDTSISLHISPAQKIDELVKEEVNVVVTETFLGKPKTKPLSETGFNQTKKELMEIYEPSFLTIKKLLKKGGVMVIAVPAFKVGNEYKRLNLESFFKKIGFTVSQTFLYHRENQIVAREIFVLT
jgi:tRNA G10  N-methylase Trm11